MRYYKFKSKEQDKILECYYSVNHETICCPNNHLKDKIYVKNLKDKIYLFFYLLKYYICSLLSPSLLSPPLSLIIYVIILYCYMYIIKNMYINYYNKYIYNIIIIHFFIVYNIAVKKYNSVHHFIIG